MEFVKPEDETDQMRAYRLMMPSIQFIERSPARWKVNYKDPDNANFQNGGWCYTSLAACIFLRDRRPFAIFTRIA